MPISMPCMTYHLNLKVFILQFSYTSTPKKLGPFTYQAKTILLTLFELGFFKSKPNWDIP